MIRKHQFIWVLLITFLLPSCEFKCNIGEAKDEKTAGDKAPVVKDDGTLLYNGIELTANRLKIKKAYLLFADGTRVPANNVIDFTQPVKLILNIDSGWVEHGDMVKLGASEKVVTDNGELILNEEDLFGIPYPDGISEEDAKIIALSVMFKPNANYPAGYLAVSFRVWDKQGEGYVKGEYRLYNK